MVAKAGMIQHRPFQRRAERRALDFVGKLCLKSAVVSCDQRSARVS
jgi:hypothetical protein